MKCDDCVNLWKLTSTAKSASTDSERVRMHLMTCSACENEFEALTAESELYARYDRELQISPAVWNGISARIATEAAAIESREQRDVRGWFAGLFAMPRFGLAFSGALAILVVMFAVGYLYLRTQPERQLLAANAKVSAPAARQSRCRSERRDLLARNRAIQKIRCGLIRI